MTDQWGPTLREAASYHPDTQGEFLLHLLDKVGVRSRDTDLTDTSREVSIQLFTDEDDAEAISRLLDKHRIKNEIDATYGDPGILVVKIDPTSLRASKIFKELDKQLSVGPYDSKKFERLL